ncbi:hypothetical protein [Sphingobium sp. C100]|uniref:hypothetical protein n=1 Tax=Sphingobium sp. C100 TaxID=1207055 RepID=UPI0013780F42|nr:hypothetical protein [Sphingobium sp. C100]
MAAVTALSSTHYPNPTGHERQDQVVIADGAGERWAGDAKLEKRHGGKSWMPDEDSNLD